VRIRLFSDNTYTLDDYVVQRIDKKYLLTLR